MMGWGGGGARGGRVAITTGSRQRPPFQGLVLHPSNGGFHGDGLLRDGGTLAPLSALVRSYQKAEHL